MKRAVFGNAASRCPPAPPRGSRPPAPPAATRLGRRRAVAGALLGLCLAAGIAGGAAAEPAAPADPRRAAADGSTESEAARPIRIVTLGDSITRGVRAGVTAEQTFAARIESQLDAAGTKVRVVNVGIGGERTDQALLRLDRIWEHRPDIVTIMYGTNDSYIDIGATKSRLPVAGYRENLIRLVTLLLERGIRPVLMTAPRWADDAAPNGLGQNPNLALEPYVTACREVAGLWRLPLVDHYAHWTAARSQGTNLRGWTTDGCHPNPAGHEVLAQTMTAGLQEVLVPPLRVRQALMAGRPVGVVCLGDSVTGVYYHTGSRRAFSDMLALALRQIAPRAQLTMVNAGVSGNTTREGLARFERDVAGRKPDLVIVMFGLNDMTRVPLEEYRRNLREIVARCRAIGSEVVLATPNNLSDTGERPAAKLIEYCDGVRAVGREAGVPVCDLYRELDAVRTGDPAAWRLLMSDAIHPNMAGHQRIAAALAQTVTGERIDVAGLAAPPAPLAQVMAALKAGRPVRLLAMPPLDRVIGSLLEERFPDAELTIEPWPVDPRGLAWIEQDAKERVRRLAPDGVLIAIPRSAGRDLSSNGFIDSYGRILSRSLNFGPPTWDVVVVHPDVWEPLATPAEHDALIRRLAAAQDLPLVDRPAGDRAEPVEALRRALNTDHD